MRGKVAKAIRRATDGGGQGNDEYKEKRVGIRRFMNPVEPKKVDKDVALIIRFAGVKRRAYKHLKRWFNSQNKNTRVTALRAIRDTAVQFA